MENNAVIQVNGVSKKFCRSLKRSMWYGFRDILRDTAGLSPKSDRLRRKEFWAIDDVSFELRKGETLGLIGPNGAGKTTILKMLNGIVLPDKGNLRIKGRVGALIQIGAGFHPQLTGRENIYINGAILGMGKREINKKFDAIVEFADIGDFLDTPVKFYSSGMFVRLGFAVAVHCEPDILLVDEILAVGDARFQAKSFRKMSELMKENSTVVFVSHRMHHIARMCSTVLFLNNGKTTEYGEPSKAIQAYRSYSTKGMDTERKHYKTACESEKVKITSISVKNSKGVETCKFYSGEKCRVEISYSAIKPIENPVITLSFTSVFDELQTHYSTKGNLENFSLKGNGIIAVDISYLGLASGKWKISMGIFAQDYMHPFAWEWYIKEIDIYERDADIMHGRFRMPHKWEVG